jgi:hypothetical protein
MASRLPDELAMISLKAIAEAGGVTPRTVRRQLEKAGVAIVRLTPTSPMVLRQDFERFIAAMSSR